MDAKTRAEFESIARHLHQLQENVGTLAERMDALLIANTGDGEDGELKRADGRMTDKGIAEINAAFASGARVTEVAERFGITVSAASNRRKIWKLSEGQAA